MRQQLKHGTGPFFLDSTNIVDEYLMKVELELNTYIFFAQTLLTFYYFGVGNVA